MDEERFQQMEKRLNKQAEATRAMNETLNKFLAVMENQEAARNVAPIPPASPPPVTTPLKVSHPPELTQVPPVISMETEHKDACSSRPASSTYHSPNQILLRTKCASIGPCPTSRVDMRRASSGELYDKRCEARRCASHLGMNLEKNSWWHSAQRTRRLQHSCDWSRTNTSRAKGM
jgi:hypothetical protein